MSGGGSLSGGAPGVASVRSPTPAVAALRMRWLALQPREQWALVLGGTVLGLYLLWAIAIQPAWRVLAAAPARLDRLDAELAAMQTLAAEARAVSTQPPLTAAQAGAALQAAAARFGPSVRLTSQGDRVVLMLDKLGRGELQQLLAEARAGARARTIEARLQPGAEGVSGTLVLGLGSPP